jgi:16S rRNA (cytosine967-C5)-methyltransferase
MTPAARYQAAIEIYADIIARRAAADRALTSWFRNHRFAGSGDRRAVTEQVYAALRHRGELAWRMQRDEARLIVLAAGGESAEQLAALCTGSQYGPAPLSADEQAALAAPAPEPMPDWARANCPEWLWPHFTDRFGAAALAEVAALGGRAPLDLRVNSLKADRESVQAALAAEGIVAQDTPYAPAGLRLEAKARLDQNALFLDGCFEPQDEAAQLCAMAVDARPGMVVIDACAGAGGKTLALAAAMQNRGRLHALDRDRRRLDRLGARAARAGASCVQIDPVDAAGGLAESGDRVLLDVPCSGTGTWRRNPEARWHLTPEDLAAQAARQRDLLEWGAAMVKPGGRLVYATCSLLRAEDEAPVEAFLVAHPDFSRMAVSGLLPGVPGVDGDLLLTPARHGTDGFFTAVLSRAV